MMFQMFSLQKDDNQELSLMKRQLNIYKLQHDRSITYCHFCTSISKKKELACVILIQSSNIEAYYYCLRLNIIWTTFIRFEYCTLLHYFLCAANIRRSGISNLHRHHPLGVPIHTFVEWTLGDPFLLPTKKFTLGQCRIRITDLSICSRTRYNWINVARYFW